jgi:hypothetical protein
LWQETILARLIFKLTPQRAKVSNREYRKILRFLEKGKGQAAEHLVVRQSETTLSSVVSMVENQFLQMERTV